MAASRKKINSSIGDNMTGQAMDKEKEVVVIVVAAAAATVTVTAVYATDAEWTTRMANK